MHKNHDEAREKKKHFSQMDIWNKHLKTNIKDEMTGVQEIQSL